MWFESSGTPQSGQTPEPGPFRLRTSTPDGTRPWIHCHMKMRLFRGRRMDHTIERGRGAEEGAMARYSDLVEPIPKKTTLRQWVWMRMVTMICLTSSLLIMTILTVSQNYIRHNVILT